jgi:hypothetical protein
MKKKLTLLFALLCVSVMGWAIAEDTYIGTTDPTYANQFKWYSVPGQTAPQEVVNIQPGTNGIALYVNVGTDLFDGVNYNGVAVATADLEDYYAKSGAGAWFYLSQFTTKCTTIEVTNSGTVIRAFRVQNDNEIGDACGTGGGDPTPDPDPEDIDWNSVSFVPGSTQYKVGALSASDLPNDVVNIQQPGWAGANQRLVPGQRSEHVRASRQAGLYLRQRRGLSGYPGAQECLRQRDFTGGQYR